MSDTKTDAGLTKVTMRLSQRDVNNAERIYKATSSRTKADAVSFALSTAAMVVDRLQSGDEVIIRRRDGSQERIVVPQVDVGR